MYVLTFLVLEVAAIVVESSPGVTSWRPSAGLGFAFVVAFGPRYAVALLGAAWLAAFWIPFPPGAPFGPFAHAVALAAGCGLAAAILRRVLRVDPRLRRVRDVALFLPVALLAPLPAAVVGTPGAAQEAWVDYLTAVESYWIRDAIGIMTLAPLLLVHALPRLRRMAKRTASGGPFQAAPAPSYRHASRAKGLPIAEALAQAASIPVVVWIVFSLRSAAGFDLYYVCLLPLLWIATSWGLPGATVGIAAIDVGLWAAVQAFPSAVRDLAELQFLQVAVPLTGLFLGAQVSARRRREDELRVAKERAENASRIKSEFLANVSHELRTPMNSILGYTELVLDGVDGPINEEQGASLRRVLTHARDLLALIDNLLDFSMLEAGEGEFSRVSFGLRGVVAEAVEAFTRAAAQKGLGLSLDVAPDVPDALLGDPSRLGQVISALVDNAIKFTSAGEVTVRAQTEARTEDKVVLRFAVSDSGPGIPEEKRSEIFKAFSQADGSLTRRHGGVGLGLAICSRLVQKMGGRLWVESQVEVGSVFRFTLAFRVPGVSDGEGSEVGNPRGGVHRT
ncbi:MAG: MASE1 domain-containing protein [Deltaproteobacteria bacterium]|nr:MASE1 domain-containing protein [Deltaproteobacteria bacterium]